MEKRKVRLSEQFRPRAAGQEAPPAPSSETTSESEALDVILGVQPVAGSLGPRPGFVSKENPASARDRGGLLGMLVRMAFGMATFPMRVAASFLIRR